MVNLIKNQVVNISGIYTLSGNAMELQFIPTDEGYFDFVQNKYFYQYKDQIGNVRLAYYKDASGSVAVDRTTDYYPFGLEFAGELNTFNSLSPNYLYGFQEQEKQQETGWHSFKWRNYDPTFIRFFNVDPLAETYAYQSPFNFSENAVTSHRELEGLEKQHVFYTPFGTIIYTSGAGAGATTQSAGLYDTAMNNARNNWNGLVRLAGKQYNILKAGATAGIVLTERILNSEGDSKGDSGKAEGGKAESGKKKTGSYTNTHQSGKKYHGKGDEKRAKQSGKEKAEKNDDPLEKTEWTEAENDREAFKQESERLDKDYDEDTGNKGHKSEKNYNERDSPGKKYREQDEQKKLNNN